MEVAEAEETPPPVEAEEEAPPVEAEEEAPCPAAAEEEAPPPAAAAEAPPPVEAAAAAAEAALPSQPQPPLMQDLSEVEDVEVEELDYDDDPLGEEEPPAEEPEAEDELEEGQLPSSSTGRAVSAEELPRVAAAAAPARAEEPPAAAAAAPSRAEEPPRVKKLVRVHWDQFATSSSMQACGGIPPLEISRGGMETWSVVTVDSRSDDDRSPCRPARAADTTSSPTSGPTSSPTSGPTSSPTSSPTSGPPSSPSLLQGVPWRMPTEARRGEDVHGDRILDRFSIITPQTALSSIMQVLRVPAAPSTVSPSPVRDEVLL